MTRKVFILGDGGHDYSDAERFGDLTLIDIPPTVKWDMSAVYDILKRELKDSTADDFIIISHMTSICCIATAIMVEWYGKVNYLTFYKGRYSEKTISLDNLDE